MDWNENLSGGLRSTPAGRLETGRRMESCPTLFFKGVSDQLRVQIRNPHCPAMHPMTSRL
jgi:hypothetical protein